MWPLAAKGSFTNHSLDAGWHFILEYPFALSFLQQGGQLTQAICPRRWWGAWARGNWWRGWRRWTGPKTKIPDTDQNVKAWLTLATKSTVVESESESEEKQQQTNKQKQKTSTTKIWDPLIKLMAVFILQTYNASGGLWANTLFV